MAQLYAFAGRPPPLPALPALPALPPLPALPALPALLALLTLLTLQINPASAVFAPRTKTHLASGWASCALEDEGSGNCPTLAGRVPPAGQGLGSYDAVAVWDVSRVTDTKSRKCVYGEAARVFLP